MLLCYQKNMPETKIAFPVPFQSAYADIALERYVWMEDLGGKETYQNKKERECLMVCAMRKVKMQCKITSNGEGDMGMANAHYTWEGYQGNRTVVECARQSILLRKVSRLMQKMVKTSK